MKAGNDVPLDGQNVLFAATRQGRDRRGAYILDPDSYMALRRRLHAVVDCLHPGAAIKILSLVNTQYVIRRVGSGFCLPIVRRYIRTYTVKCGCWVCQSGFRVDIVFLFFLISR